MPIAFGAPKRAAARQSRSQQNGPRPSEILTAAAFRNALIVTQSIGGSTNALIHLTAIAGRLGIRIDLDEFDALGRKVPVLIDLKPSGQHYMEHFHWAGGVPRLLRELEGLLDTSARTVTGSLRDTMNASDRNACADRDPAAQ